MQPLFSFGAIADVQFADQADGSTEGRKQLYREAPGKLAAAVQYWQQQQGQLAFVLNLGDTVNGNSAYPENNTAELEKIASIFDRLGSELPVHHVLGNHCLSVDRKQLLTRLRMPASFYAVSLPHKWRLVVLDTTEMSGHSGLPSESEAAREAEEFQQAHPLSESDPHMSSWNGGITSSQMRWLQDELRGAEAAGERVIVAAHHQAGKGGARDTHLAWNWRDISAVLTASPAFRLYLAGHDHMGGYVESGGKHWLTLQGLLEAPTGSNAFAIVRVCQDHLELQGSGTVPSRTLLV